MKIRPIVAELFHAHGRTDRYDEANRLVALRSSSNAPKNFNAIMAEPKKIPECLTTGITYVLPQSGDSKKIRNYPPITWLKTMYKTLTGIMVRRISTHLDKILSAEQKVCHPGRNGSKD